MILDFAVFKYYKAYYILHGVRKLYKHLHFLLWFALFSHVGLSVDYSALIVRGRNKIEKCAYMRQATE
jgi:hypothetical protein